MLSVDQVEERTDKAPMRVWLFTVLSCATMVGWTSIGGSIEYLSAKYGSDFFVWVNFAFYVSGLPLSLVMKWNDARMDFFYGAQRTYTFRLLVSLCSMSALLCALPFASESFFLFIVSLIGLCTWAANGAISSLASMAKNGANTYQLVGFVLPALPFMFYVMFFGVEPGQKYEKENLIGFFTVTATLVLPGVAAAVVMLQSDAMKDVLQAKDRSVHRGLLRKVVGYSNLETIEEAEEDEGEGDKGVEGEEVEDEDVVSLADHEGEKKDELSPLSCVAKNDLKILLERKNSYNSTTTNSTAASSSLSHASSSGIAELPVCVGGTLPDEETANPLLESLIESQRNNAPISTQSQTILKDLVLNDPSLLQPDSKAGEKLYYHYWALFIVIMASTVEGAFFGFVKSSYGICLVTILFFTRTLADFLGRPLGFYAAPVSISTPRGLFVASCLRLVLGFTFFFSYVFYAEHCGFLNDAVIIAYQFIFSFTSGYFVVLAYEFATAEFKDSTDRSYGSKIMTQAFQSGCFTGVIVAIIVVVLKNSMA